MGEIGTEDKRFSIQLGWTGYLRNSGYQYVAGSNPWIWAPQTVMNTRIEERYAGVKGAVGDHFSFSAKMAYNKLNNQPLFLNSLKNGGKSFEIIYEPEMDQFQLGGEMGLTFGEQFSLISNLSINKYRKLEVNDKAWGLLPLEFTTKMRIQVLKDLFVTSDLFAFDGPWYQKSDGDAKQMDGALDLSAGAEFKILKNVKLWAQFNNIFNKEYQRWNQYPVYGFGFLGGVVFSFAQKQSQ
jgi:outer membrane receptor protein involved in Fe transport